MSDNVLNALRLLKVYTADRFDIWMLAGASKASCRAHVMSTLCGLRVPQSKSGVNAIRATLYSAGNITGDCPYERENNFIAWAKSVLNAAPSVE